MELEKQVCSLILSKKLEKLGVEQRSLWYWTMMSSPELRYIDQSDIAQYDSYSAFTATELGELLPVTIDVGKKGYGISSELLTFQKGDFGKGIEWQVRYYDVHFINANTEADARAKMLVYLLEKKIITL